MYSKYQTMFHRVPKWSLLVFAVVLPAVTGIIFDLPRVVLGTTFLFVAASFASNPIVDFFHRLKIIPNQVTLSGLLFSIASALLFAGGHVAEGGFACWLTGLLDLWDGLLARKHNLTTKFGGFLDSVLDRIADGFIFSGIAFHMFMTGSPVGGGLALYGLVTALVVSYSRAKAETQIRLCEVGFLGGRPERIFLLCYFGLIGHLQFGLGLICLFQTVTIIRRIVFTYRALSDEDADSVHRFEPVSKSRSETEGSSVEFARVEKAIQEE